MSVKYVFLSVALSNVPYLCFKKIKNIYVNIKKGKLLVLCKEKLKGTLGCIVFIFLFFIHTSLTF